MKRKGIWRIVLPASVFLVMMLSVTSCGKAGNTAEQREIESGDSESENAGPGDAKPENAGPEDAPEKILGAVGQAPGKLENGLFVSSDGHFTVRAGEDKWEVSELDGEWELRMTEDPSVSISFSPAGGITPEMVDGFDGAFADSYVETLKESYPDVKKKETRRVNDSLVGMDIVMTDPGSGYQIYQILYLAADGFSGNNDTNGCMILSSLSEKESDSLAGEVRQVIESFEFISK